VGENPPPASTASPGFTQEIRGFFTRFLIDQCINYDDSCVIKTPVKNGDAVKMNYWIGGDMNKLTAVALASVLATGTGVARAQSSVTLYGRIDAGVEYVNGAPTGQNPVTGASTGSGSRFRAESGDWGTSLWGIKGVEDLGGGNKAVFHLEGAFNTMTGQGPSNNGLFDRYATVGIANDRFGTVLLGKELFLSNGVWDFDPFGQSNWSSASLVRGRNWNHTSNNISYQSPTIAGFDISGQYALSNATNWNGNGTTGQGRADAIQLTYTQPVFQIRAIYDEWRDAANGTLDDAFNFSREYFGGVNVFLGKFKLQAVYRNRIQLPALCRAASQPLARNGAA
jgi:predicted porin